MTLEILVVLAVLVAGFILGSIYLEPRNNVARLEREAAIRVNMDIKWYTELEINRRLVEAYNIFARKNNASYEEYLKLVILYGKLELS